MTVTIVPATVRDVTYIAADMRPDDWREIACQVHDGVTPGQIAAAAVAHGESYVATLDGQPVAAFGVMPATVNVLTIWAWGTPRTRRVVPAITRFTIADLVPRWLAAGITRVEARSIAGHDAAHRWLRALGTTETALPEWGKGGEAFILFAWTRAGWLERTRSDVLRQGSNGPD